MEKNASFPNKLSVSALLAVFPVCLSLFFRIGVGVGFKVGVRFRVMVGVRVWVMLGGAWHWSGLP